MRKLYLKNFRAFRDDFTVELKGLQEHALLYGENGAGKSSLYEALKIIFFYERLDKEIIADAVDEADEERRRRQWRQRNICKMSAVADFKIQLDNTDYGTDLDVSHYKVCMLSNGEIPIGDKISVKKLLKDAYITGLKVDAILNDEYNRDFLIDYVNESLKTDFFETIEVSYDQTDEFNLTLKDLSRNDLEETTQLLRCFNEAKIKLVSLLIMLSAAELVFSPYNGNNTYLLILDDIINSLDIANRDLLVRHIFKRFPDEKYCKFVMTHNVSYYNLWHFYVNDFQRKTHNKWYFASLYVSADSSHKLFDYEEDKVDNIEKDYKAAPNDPMIGNRLRQHFERLLYETARIAQVGPFNESGTLIANLVRKKNAFIYAPGKGDPKNVYDMVDEIQEKIRYTTKDKVKKELKVILDKYNAANYYWKLLDIVDNVKLYQKVVLHQSSHGHMGSSTFSNKEITATIALLRQMEKVVNENKDKDVYTI